MTLGAAAGTKRAFGMIHPLAKDERWLAVALAIIVHLLGWLLFVLCGFEDIVSRPAILAFLGACLLVNSIVHLICSWICAMDASFWFLKATEFTRQHRKSTTCAHIASAVFWFVIALYALGVFKHSDSNGGSEGSGGTATWQLDGAGVTLSLDLLAWSFLITITAISPRPMGMLHPPGSGIGLAALLTFAGLVHLLAWTLWVLNLTFCVLM